MATFIIDDLRRENYRLRHFLNERKYYIPSLYLI